MARVGVTAVAGGGFAEDVAVSFHCLYAIADLDAFENMNARDLQMKVLQSLKTWLEPHLGQRCLRVVN